MPDNYILDISFAVQFQPPKKQTAYYGQHILTGLYDVPSDTWHAIQLFNPDIKEALQIRWGDNPKGKSFIDVRNAPSIP